MFSLNRGLWYYLVEETKVCNELWEIMLLTLSFTLISVFAGYLLGSVNSAIVVSKIFYGDDVRNHGSGNAGLTNTLRTYGKKAALFTLLGDVLKTVLAIFIGAILGGFNYVGGISMGKPMCEIPFAYLAGFFSIVGHIIPIYYGFKGGKGVLCTAAMALVLTPVEFAILILVFIGIVAWTKYVSLGSVTVGVLYPIVVAAHTRLAWGASGSQDGIVTLITVLIACIIVYCHRGNLARISKGTERKLSFKSKPAVEATAEAPEKAPDDSEGSEEK